MYLIESIHFPIERGNLKQPEYQLYIHEYTSIIDNTHMYVQCIYMNIHIYMYTRKYIHVGDILGVLDFDLTC